MFTFHKPKVFRSVNGCCICKAKSSSSRFTDSKRYEHSFEKCFDLSEERSGEICNACVLLVKRFMKLPAGSGRHWNHVVDARSGPGIKSNGRTKGGKITKPKSVVDQQENDTPDKIKRKHVYKSKYGRGRALFRPVSRKYRKKQPVENMRHIPKGSSLSRLQQISFLDSTIWKEERICCGVIFRGPNGEVAIDTRYLTPCGACRVLKEPAVPGSSSGSCSTDSVSSNDHRMEDVMTDSESVNNDNEAVAAIRGKLGDGEVDDEGFFDRQAGSPFSTSSALQVGNKLEEDSSEESD